MIGVFSYEKTIWKNEHMQALCVEPVNRYLYSKAHVLNSKHESLGQAIFSILHTSNQSKIKIWTHQSRSWRFGVIIKTLCGETIAYMHNIYIEREKERDLSIALKNSVVTTD